MDYKPLNCLNLSNNRIGDEGLAALVLAISAAASENLETLDLSDNLHTIAGIRLLSACIQSERTTLKVLALSSGIGDADQEEVTRILANALSNNTSLMDLDLGYVISEAGTEAFSRLLCDTSSINNIYSSNHTLESVSYFPYFIDRGENFSIEKYLHLNRYSTKLEPRHRQLIPMLKILIHYPDLADMKPFYQWKLSCLPLVADWFQRASAFRDYLDESVEVFQRRELSGLYKFIRGVPLLVADGYWSQQLKQIHVKKRKFDEAEKQLLEILAKKRKLEEEEMQVLHRLGGKRETG